MAPATVSETGPAAPDFAASRGWYFRPADGSLTRRGRAFAVVDLPRARV